MMLWEGPSLLDGRPIVAIATIRSRNAKTGDMVQTWILRRDFAPLEAVALGAERSVCGDCPQRHYLGGGCYVNVGRAPTAVWKRYRRGGYGAPAWRGRVARALLAKPIRLGSYGDPAAVPFEIWETLLAQGCRRWSGYTHQWRSCDPRLRGIVMASCDSLAEAEEARASGWRVFLVLSGGAPRPLPFIECPSDARGLTCEQCAVCDGTRATSRSPGAVSVAIEVHGAWANRFALPVVR